MFSITPQGSPDWPNPRAHGGLKGERRDREATEPELATADLFGEAQTAQFNHFRVAPCESFGMPATH